MHRAACLVVGLMLGFAPWGTAQAADQDLMAWWAFDDIKPSSQKTLTTRESIQGTECPLIGLSRFVPGVKGHAMKFDGFSSAIDVPYTGLPQGPSITLEAWIALGAYPWNWAPILTIGKYKVTGFYFGVDDKGRLGFQLSDGTYQWHACRSHLDPKTHVGIPLNTWTHVAATLDREQGMTLYVNGEPVDTHNAFEFRARIDYSMIEARNEGFRLGMNREHLAPTDPVRTWATYPSQYSFDGIMDEVKIHKHALSAERIRTLYEAVQPEHAPEFAPRRFPTVKPSGRFGANFTRLQYYPAWDAIWPDGDFMDVVVQFDELPIKVMFWRGTRYSACWVSENGKWMADQSRETGYNWKLSEGSRDELVTGCVEHMSDTQTRSARVAIIENNDARVVVNWRYLQMDVKFRQKDVPTNTGFGQWGNELYTIYPDGVGVRSLYPGYGGWQETIFLNEPGTRPEDNVELEAITLLNLKGDQKTYSWEHGFPRFDMDDAVIQVVNFKSEYRPFLVISAKGRGFGVFSGEVRPRYSHFPWWNHWPVAQVMSDGRYCVAADRAAHSSLSYARAEPVPAALYGMTRQAPQSLVPLARSWNHPPELEIVGAGATPQGYDLMQRAYVMQVKQNRGVLAMTLKASKDSPCHNPAFVINDWAPEHLTLLLDDQRIQRGKNFRYGVEYDVEGRAKTVIWLRHKAEEPVNIALVPGP